MNSRVGNHPSQIFPVNQDQFPSWKSSLPDISCKSGSISPTGIIPLRLFPQIRIIFPDENHPSQTFPVNQDQFTRRKSSLPDFSCKSGSIFPLEIIPAKAFHQIRINSPAGNHPSQTFPVNQDQFPRRKSSLPDFFVKSG